MPGRAPVQSPSCGWRLQRRSQPRNLSNAKTKDKFSDTKNLQELWKKGGSILEQFYYTNVKQAATYCKKIQFLNVLKSEGGSGIGNNLKQVESRWGSTEEGTPKVPDPLLILPKLIRLGNSQFFSPKYLAYCLAVCNRGGTYLQLLFQSLS